MMADLELNSLAESRAKKTEALRCFGSLNLAHIKRQVSELLRLIGTNGIFDEYTKHDISHINSMLELVTEAVIPNKTQSLLTPTDWLMIVLSIYFHDLGMLVTRREYLRRHESGFPEFRQRLLDGPQGRDYDKRLSALPSEDEKERFIYQEFVRNNHAKRIRDWVTGAAASELGVADEAASAVSNILEPLGDVFRRDLGLVAESHHADDLHDFKKYKTSQPYGTQRESTANLQYAALVLREADLLHMTCDRTPSIMFRTINPGDPLSQREWAKQMAVRSVRVQFARDSDGKLDENLPQDTLEVHAFFNDEEGFFGLTSYLDYVEKQLKQNALWAQQAQKEQGVKYELPWRRIDQQFIETEGFLKEQLSFEVDTYRILELLTGHTLYNDAGVVVRELTQNALDAVRLQFFDPTGTRASDNGQIRVLWEGVTRTLSIIDNGTGMDETIIRDNLLRVGASRYQNPKFQEEYPDFTPISRFGIGVLSAFMVADDVEYITCYAGSENVRRIVLRSLHGKYLTRLMPKSEPVARNVVPHGTEVRLKLRPSAALDDIPSLVRKWIVVPGCPVSLQVDQEDPIRVGFKTPKEALEKHLADEGLLVQRAKVKVEQRVSGGLTLAYAVQWSEYFREWSFLAKPARLAGNERSDTADGICIEGVRITSGSPGFDGSTIYALANFTGRSAPKTDVTRSSLDSGSGRESALGLIYSLYLAHIEDELRRLYSERRFSITWAAQEARFLLESLFSERRRYGSSEGIADRSVFLPPCRNFVVCLLKLKEGGN